MSNTNFKISATLSMCRAFRLLAVSVLIGLAPSTKRTTRARAIQLPLILILTTP